MKVNDRCIFSDRRSLQEERCLDWQLWLLDKGEEMDMLLYMFLEEQWTPREDALMHLIGILMKLLRAILCKNSI